MKKLIFWTAWFLLATNFVIPRECKMGGVACQAFAARRSETKTELIGWAYQVLRQLSYLAVRARSSAGAP